MNTIVEHNLVNSQKHTLPIFFSQHTFPWVLGFERAWSLFSCFASKMFGCVFERQKAVTVVTLLSSAQLALNILLTNKLLFSVILSLNNWGHHDKKGNLTKNDRIDTA